MAIQSSLQREDQLRQQQQQSACLHGTQGSTWQKLCHLALTGAWNAWSRIRQQQYCWGNTLWTNMPYCLVESTDWDQWSWTASWLVRSAERLWPASKQLKFVVVDMPKWLFCLWSTTKWQGKKLEVLRLLYNKKPVFVLWILKINEIAGVHREIFSRILQFESTKSIH